MAGVAALVALLLILFWTGVAVLNSVLGTVLLWV